MKTKDLIILILNNSDKSISDLSELTGLSGELILKIMLKLEEYGLVYLK